MKKKILVIEDDEAVGNLIKDLLENNDFTVTWARDGQEGLAKYMEDSYDLLVVDVKMPKLDGFEVCKRIRQRPFGLISPIIILSVKDTLKDKIEGLCLGADEYLAKPFYTEGILKRIPIVLEYKKKKLLEHPLTNIPSFTKFQVRFDELTGKDCYFVYTELSGYFDNITANTQQMITLIKGFGSILGKHIKKSNYYHLDGFNFCLFLQKKKFNKIIRKIFKDFRKDVKKTFKGTTINTSLKLIALDLEDKKGKNILDMGNSISKLTLKLTENENQLINEKEEILKEIHFS